MSITVKKQYRMDRFAIPKEVYKKYPEAVNSFRWVRLSDEDANLDTKEYMGYAYVELPADALAKKKVLGKKNSDVEKGASYIKRGDMILMVAPKEVVDGHAAAIQNEVDRRMKPTVRQTKTGGEYRSNTGTEASANISDIKKLHDTITAKEEIRIERGRA